MFRRRKLQQEQLRLQKVLKNKFFLEEGKYRVLCMGVHSTLLYFLNKNCIIYSTSKIVGRISQKFYGYFMKGI